MTDLPEVKLRALPTFPASVQVESPVQLEIVNGIYRFSLDMTAIAGTTFDAISPTTTRGDLIVQGPSSDQRLALGTAGQALVSNGTDPVWAGFDALAPTTTRGDLIFRNATTNARLAAGTSGFVLTSGGAGADPAWAGFTQGDTGAISKPYIAKLRDTVSILDYYSDATFTTDAGPAFNNALSQHKAVYIPPLADGLYYPITTPIAIVQNGQKLRGEGVWASKLRGTTANTSIITIADGLNGVEIEGLHLLRAVNATAGGAGIHCLGGLSNCNIYNNFIQDQYNGMVLRSADWGYVERNTISGSFSDSILGTNTTFAWAWQFDNNLITRGDGNGIYFVVSAVVGAPSVCPVGPMTNTSAFALTGSAIVIVGTPSIKVSNVAIRGGFLGSTSTHAISLDTYEGYHTIDNVKIEQVGVDPTGRNYTTPASTVGSAINLSANNTQVNIVGGHIQTMAHNGISAACDVNVNGTTILNCGATGTAGLRAGVSSSAGRANVVGVRSGNTAGSAQSYGVQTANGVNLNVVGCDLSGNGVAPIVATINPTWVQQVGNFPATLPVQIPQTGVLVGATATGGAPTTAGRINVDDSVRVDNVALT